MIWETFAVVHELGLPKNFDSLDPSEQLELIAAKLVSKQLNAMLDEIRVELRLACQAYDAADAQERKSVLLTSVVNNDE